MQITDRQKNVMMKVVLLACFQEGFNYILVMTPVPKCAYSLPGGYSVNRRGQFSFT